MACCKAKTVSDSKKGEAVISCFVRYDRSIYAVVCRHVTVTASGSFFVKDMEAQFARKMRKNVKNKLETFINNDIDLIEINTERMQKACKPVFRNAEGKIKSERIFMGHAEDLIDETVFQCYKTDTEEGYISRSGKILPLSKINQTIKESYCMETHFVVGDDTFADAGDSGRIVAYETRDGNLELVGIIVHKFGEHTVCLLLRDGLKYLNQQYDLELTLYESQRNTTDGEIEIEPGQVMTFSI